MYYVYILRVEDRAGRQIGKISTYVGSTDDIVRRLDEHLRGIYSNYLRRYHRSARLTMIYAEVLRDKWDALRREKELKSKSKDFKLRLGLDVKNILASPLRYEAGHGFIVQIKEGYWFRSNLLDKLGVKLE